MVLRVPMPTPCAVGVRSVKSRAGSWQVAQETAPFELIRRSANSDAPRRAARGLSATRLVGSAGGGPRASVDMPRSVRSCSSVQSSVCGAAATAAASAPAPTNSRLKRQVEGDIVGYAVRLDGELEHPPPIH